MLFDFKGNKPVYSSPFFPNEKVRLEIPTMFFTAIIELKPHLPLPLGLILMLCKEPCEFDLEPNLPSSYLIRADNAEGRFEAFSTDELSDERFDELEIVIWPFHLKTLSNTFEPNAKAE